MYEGDLGGGVGGFESDKLGNATGPPLARVLGPTLSEIMGNWSNSSLDIPDEKNEAEESVDTIDVGRENEPE